MRHNEIQAPKRQAITPKTDKSDYSGFEFSFIKGILQNSFEEIIDDRNGGEEEDRDK